MSDLIHSISTVRPPVLLRLSAAFTQLIRRVFHPLSAGNPQIFRPFSTIVAHAFRHVPSLPISAAFAARFRRCSADSTERKWATERQVPNSVEKQGDGTP